MLSTSGGIAYEIARHLVENGFKYMGLDLIMNNYVQKIIQLIK